MARVPANDAREEDERQGSGELEAEATPPTIAEQWDELEPPDAAGLTVYRMSGLGGDLSQLVAGALEYPSQAPPWLQGYLDEGTAAEAEIIRLFCEEYAKRPATYPELATLTAEGVIAGYGPVEAQAQVWLRVGTTSLVRGHCDSIVCINPKSEKNHAFAVLEVKKFRPTLWKLWQKNRKNKKLDHPFQGDPTLEKYAWQVSALSVATGLPVYFVVGEFDPKAEALTGTIDALLIPVDAPVHTKGEIVARVMKAKKHVDSGEVPVCELHDESCFYAAHDFCPGKIEKAGEELDDQELGRLLGLYYAYGVDMAATDEQKQAEKDRKAVKEQIDKLVADRGYARSKGDDKHVFRVWDEAGNEYEYEWVTYEIKPRGGTTGNKLDVKLVIDATAVAPEDHPE